MIAAHTTAECYFLDVGQGTSNVVLLGRRRAIVIDCGPASFIPLKLLRRYADQIVALIVSHNDRDHHGGAAQILAAYPKAIDRLYFLQDRPVEHIRLYAIAKHELQAGNLLRPPIRLERQDRPVRLFRDEQTSVSVELLFPTLLDNLDAQAGAAPNATSAVLALMCGNRRIVFPGDSSIEEWRRIHAYAKGSVSCDVFGVPHHGGLLTEKRARETRDAFQDRARSELQWLFAEAVRCDFAVASVGTNNRYEHPREHSIRAIANAGITVLCTQITPRCHDALETVRPGVLRPLLPGRSRVDRDVSTNGKSRNVACAGTVVAEIGPSHIAVHRLHEHQTAVDRLCQTPAGHPLCRPSGLRP